MGLGVFARADFAVPAGDVEVEIHLGEVKPRAFLKHRRHKGTYQSKDTSTCCYRTRITQSTISIAGLHQPSKKYYVRRFPYETCI
jgi:hypothetical protein